MSKVAVVYWSGTGNTEAMAVSYTHLDVYKRQACYYRITRCPICIYAEKLGVSELMPLFCELDEVMITLQHGVLHRKQTLANGGEYCDYFITGNRE